MIIPSIDIMGGKAVQLRQGKDKVLERSNVLGLAKEFRKYGEIAVVDLDAAFGRGNNTTLISELCKIADCRVGGGIRTVEKANEILSLGAKKIIIGTMASKQFLKQLPKDRLIVAIDTKEGKVVDKAWTHTTSKTPFQKVKELEQYCSEFLFTNVDREGLMQGIDTKIIKQIQNKTQRKITVAGGITSITDIQTLERMDVNAQIGMALYTGKIKLDDAFISVLDFTKGKGLIPTITQDKSGRVLMLAYSSKESLKLTFRSNYATYYSRSRKKIWKKGETSGDKQTVFKVRYDCDRDALLFTVDQKNVACHTGRYSCFFEKGYTFEDLYAILKARMDHPKKGSYTSKLLNNEKSIMSKICEESGEVIHYKDRENLVWEIADLTFFVMALMVKNNISIEEIKNELWRRHK